MPDENVDFYVGVVLAVLSAILSNTGLNTQKLCHVHAKKERRKRRSLQPGHGRARGSGRRIASLFRARSRSHTVRFGGAYEAAGAEDLDLEAGLDHDEGVEPPQRLTSQSLAELGEGLDLGGNSNGNGNGDGLDEDGDEGDECCEGPGSSRRKGSLSEHSSNSVTSSSALIRGPRSGDATAEGERLGEGQKHHGALVTGRSPLSKTRGKHMSMQDLHGEDAEGDSGDGEIAYWKQPLWLVGLLLVIVGSIADFAALAFAPQTIIAPLGSLTLVSNVFLAPYFSGEAVTLRDLLSTLCVVVGSVLAVSYGSHENTEYTQDELFAYFSNARFAAYALVIAGTISALYLALRYIERVQEDDSPEKRREYRALRKLHKFFYGAISGVSGAQSVLFAKCAAELVRDGPELFLRWQSYLIVFAMLATIFMQIRWLNEGLRRFDALYMVPVFQSCWIFFSVVSGLVVLGEFKHLDHSAVSVFCLGVTITIFGVYSLSQRVGLSDRNMSLARRMSFSSMAVGGAVSESSSADDLSSIMDDDDDDMGVEEDNGEVDVGMEMMEMRKEGVSMAR